MKGIFASVLGATIAVGISALYFIWRFRTLAHAYIGLNPLLFFAIGFASVVIWVVREQLWQDVDTQGKLKSSVLRGASFTTIGKWFQGTGTQSVAQESAEYTKLFNAEEERKSNYMRMVNAYYNLCTDFYEWGWGKSFHFGRRFKGESFDASLARHEMWLAHRGGFQKGMNIMDLGCGVGGPMRSIARFTEAKVTGINNNAYQISRGTIQNKEAKLDHLCSFKQTDFMKLDVPTESMDGAYAIEATCHAPDKTECFREIFRCLKPGGVFCGYEWVMTDKYEPGNADHRKIKKGIELGDGLPDMPHCSEVSRALRAAGFDVVEAFDVSIPEGPNEVPWYQSLEAGFSPSQFHHSRLGIFLTHLMVRVFEFIGVAPKGSTATHAFLTVAPPNLVAGGKTQIFTPMFWFKAQKPRSSSSGNLSGLSGLIPTSVDKEKVSTTDNIKLISSH